METIKPIRKNLKIKIANRNDSDKINKLRKAAYQEATGTKLLDFSFLNWGCADDNAGLIAWCSQHRHKRGHLGLLSNGSFTASTAHIVSNNLVSCHHPIG